MKKLLVVTGLVLSSMMLSCDSKPYDSSYQNPNYIYDTLSVSKMVDSLIKQTPNISGNVANQNDVMYKIMYNNFYTIYNHVPMKFYETSEGVYVEDRKKVYYLVSFTNEFKTKNHNRLSLNVNVLMEEKDVKTLEKDSLYVLTGDFSKFHNPDYKGSISQNDDTYEVSFPIVYLKNDKNKHVPFTFKKISHE